MCLVFNLSNATSKLLNNLKLRFENVKDIFKCEDSFCFASALSASPLCLIPPPQLLVFFHLPCDMACVCSEQLCLANICGISSRSSVLTSPALKGSRH